MAAGWNKYMGFQMTFEDSDRRDWSNFDMLKLADDSQGALHSYPRTFSFKFLYSSG
jgi:hypothetical protein